MNLRRDSNKLIEEFFLKKEMKSCNNNNKINIILINIHSKKINNNINKHQTLEINYKKISIKIKILSLKYKIKNSLLIINSSSNNNNSKNRKRNHHKTLISMN